MIKNGTANTNEETKGEKMNLQNARIIGFFSIPSPSIAEHNPSAYYAAMSALPAGAGTCAHCGTGIIHHVVVSYDGKTLFIGTTCAEKCGLDRDQVRYKQTSDERDAYNLRVALRDADRKQKEADKAQQCADFHADRLLADAVICRGIVAAIGSERLAAVVAYGWTGAAEVALSLLGGDLNIGGYRLNSISMFRLADECGKLSGRRNSKAYNAASAAVQSAFGEDVVDYISHTPAQLGWTPRNFDV